MTFCHAHGIGRTTCYDLINSGKIRSVMIGGRRVIPIEEGEKLLNPQT
jgi:excisionase family DNA binding protein